MRRLPCCRILRPTAPQPGAWNMALDEALLESVSRGTAPCTVRWYRWSEATVSLGYFQQADAIADDSIFSHLPRVRRLSGGGAILHHHEWTYSCVVPAAQQLVARPQDLYTLVHRVVIECLTRRGFPLRLRGATTRDEAFLCFGRSDAHDVLLHGHKVLGSAQRRRRGTILQHGSLLVRHSEFAPQFPGLLDLEPAGDLDGIEAELPLLLGKALGERTLMDDFTPQEQQSAAKLQQRYEGVSEAILNRT